jgi:hypothetical protein
VTTYPPASDVAIHEAYHASSLCIAGLPPLFARIDEPGHLLGSVAPDWDTHGVSEHTAREVLIAQPAGCAR